MAYFDRNMIVRIVTTLVSIPVIVGVVSMGGWWLYAVLLAVGSVCFLEYGGVVAHDDRFARGLLFLVGSLTVAGGMMVHDDHLALLTPQLACLLIAIVYVLRPGDLDTVWARMSALAFGVIYVALAHIAIFRLRELGAELPARTSPVVWVWLPLCCAWGNDSAAYFAGKAFGKHKMYPLLSPKKSWEGFVGGAAGCVGLPFVLLFAFRPWLLDVSPLDIFFVAVPAIVLAPVGDLIESMMKRSYHAKDAGSILPGHGGFLDRVDAVYIVAPWTLLYVSGLRPYIVG